jgi:hypothetical protein
LLHQPDPGAFVGLVAEHIKSGGIIAFHEASVSPVYEIFPSIEIQRQCFDWILAVFGAAGASIEVASHMGRDARYCIGNGEVLASHFPGPAAKLLPNRRYVEGRPKKGLRDDVRCGGMHLPALLTVIDQLGGLHSQKTCKCSKRG